MKIALSEELPTTLQSDIHETRVPTILFDFDGTIADSFEAILAIANRVATEFGLQPASESDIEYYRNLSTRQVIQQAKVSPIQLPRILRRVRLELQQEIQHVQPIPGIKEALAHLRQRGYHLAILTSNSEANVAAFLANHDLADRFDFIYSKVSIFGKARTLRRCLRLQQLNPDRTLYVGDEARDIDAARQAGVGAIAVGWGFNSPQVLSQRQPDYLIRHPRELGEAVAKWTAASA